MLPHHVAILHVAILLTACIPILALSAPAAEKPAADDLPAARVELLYCKGQNLLPMLLATGQIDGYVAWQPCLALAEESGIGKVVALSQDFPPQGLWQNHPCCVLAADDTFVEVHLDLVAALCALTMLSTKFVSDNPEQSMKISSEWLMGGRNYTFGENYVPSEEVFKRSFSTSVFSCRPDEHWNRSARALVLCMADLLNIMQGPKVDTGSELEADTETNSKADGSKEKELDLYDHRPYQAVLKMIEEGDPAAPRPVMKRIRIGYLMIDHQAPLFAAVKNWRYFQETYGMALKPEDETAMRPQVLDFIVGGEKVAEIDLITAPTGQTLMTLLEQDCLDMAYVGITPAIGSISLGCDAKIILPFQNQGSGLVLPASSPVRGWDDFVSLAKSRYAEGRPLKVADPDLGTIADVIFQSALKEEGIECLKAEGT